MGMHLLGGRGNYGASRREYKLFVKYPEILEENLCPVLARHFPWNGYFFQDDNAPVHRSRSTQEYMVRNHINCPSSSAQSPYLSIIENVWLYIKKCLKTPISLWGCEIESWSDRGNSADLDRNHACLHSELVWLDTKANSAIYSAQRTPHKVLNCK